MARFPTLEGHSPGMCMAAVWPGGEAITLKLPGGRRQVEFACISVLDLMRRRLTDDA